MTLTIDRLEAMCGNLAPKAFQRSPTFTLQKSSDIAELQSILAVLDPDAGRGDGSLSGPDGQPADDYWFGVVLASMRHYGEPAREVLREWSRASPRYDEGSFDKECSEAGKHHDNPVTIKSLKSLAAHFGWKPLPRIKRYRLLDRDAIMAIPPIEWRVKGIFPTTGIGAIYGPSGAGKSFVALGLAMSIAEGSLWFGRRTTPCQVVYVMLEGEGGLRNRVCAWEVHHGRNAPSDFAAVPEPFSFSSEEDVSDLAAEIPNGSVVIVDTLNRAAPGSDENSSKDMGEVIAGMKMLQSLINGLVLVVHHTGKDTSRGLRGHSSLHAALDGAIEVKKATEGLSWTSAKVKDGDDSIVENFRLTQVSLGKDEDGFITSCVAEPSEAPKVKKQPSGRHQIAALRILRELGSCLSEDEAVSKIADSLVSLDPKRRKQAARSALQGLIAGSFIRMCDGKVLVEPG